MKTCVEAGEKAGINLAPLFACGGHQTYASNIAEMQYAAVIYVFDICLSMVSRECILGSYDAICDSYCKHLAFGTMDAKTCKPGILTRISFMFQRLVINRGKDADSDVRYLSLSLSLSLSPVRLLVFLLFPCGECRFMSQGMTHILPPHAKRLCADLSSIICLLT